jgi:hypothetical protein
VGDEFANPTFMFSSTGGSVFSVRYPTNPIDTFHIAGAMSQSYDPEDNLIHILKWIRDEFKGWCNSFRDMVSPSTHHFVVIRGCITDPLDFSLSLQNLSSEHHLRFHFQRSKLRPLDFHESLYGTKAPDHLKAPTTFSVIDTNSLADFIGLLPLLTSVSPLLANHPSSILLTQLTPPFHYTSVKNILAHHLLDTPTLCILLKLVPIEYLSQFSPESTITDLDRHRQIPPIVSSSAGRLQCTVRRRFWIRVGWKRSEQHSNISNLKTATTYSCETENIVNVGFYMTVFLSLFFNLLVFVSIFSFYSRFTSIHTRAID